MADKNHKNVEVSKLKVTVSGDKKTAYASWEPPTGNVSRVFRKKGVSPKTYTVKKSPGLRSTRCTGATSSSTRTGPSAM